MANSLHLYWKRVASLYKHSLCVYHFAQTTGSTLTKKKKIRACATLMVYVYLLMFHVDLSRHFYFRSLRCSINRVHFVLYIRMQYCYCHCYYQLSPDVVTSVAITQRSLDIR